VIDQDAFVARRRTAWDELDALLGAGRDLHKLPPANISRAAALYRSVCSDLMRARAAGYDADVVRLLDALAARAHGALYRAPPHRVSALWDLVAREFPRTLRRHGRAFACATALMIVPAIVSFAGSRQSREFALQVLPEETAEQMEAVYADDMSRGRDEATDLAMAGFYVSNNVGIAFRCFSTGVLFGLGSVFFLVYNGLVFGAVAGLVSRAGHGRNLFTFVAGHGAFELTAIVVAATAGLVMGYALVATGGLTRWASLRRRAPDVARLVMGAALMLLVAAGIEGFWSPAGFPAPVKWSVAAALWVAVAAYLAFAGREARA
jgi:uncharacterized membrane protein SpoIIM required for sporulation